MCFAETACEDDYHVFDENNQFIQHKYPVMPPVVEYDSWGNISKLCSSINFSTPPDAYTSWVYDENRTLLRMIRCNNDECAEEWEFVYDAHGFLAESISSSGVVTRYENEHDAQGRILLSTSSAGIVITYEYADDGS